MIADLLSIDMEVNLVHNIQPMNFVKANLLLEQQRRMARLCTPSQNVQEQYMATMEMLDQSDTNAQTLNKYAMTLYLFADSKEELRFGQDEVERICRYYNVTPVREGWAAQATFFSQFPTYNDGVLLAFCYLGANVNGFASSIIYFTLFLIFKLSVNFVTSLTLVSYL
jgi:type IV secretory pathway VirB4 component